MVALASFFARGLAYHLRGLSIDLFLLSGAVDYRVTLPTDAQISELHLIDTPRMAKLLNLSKASLYMRIRRGSFPEPHFRLGGPSGCLVWIITKELAAVLKINPEDL